MSSCPATERSALAVSPEVRVSACEDGVVFLHSGAGSIFSANATGARIWEEIERGATPEQAGATLARDFGIDQEIAVRDAVRFVAELEAEGILVRRRAA